MSERVEAVGEGTSLADRKRRAGQRLVIGFSGPSVDEDLRALVKEIQPAGFILFARNVEDPQQVTELNRELASLVDPSAPALIGVDQEGGRVQRVRAPATVWPTMLDVARAETLTEDISRAMARELRAMGFNLNFAPVADVNSNPNNPVIGDRSFGDQVTTVSKHVDTFIRAHQAEGIIACAKHFPGHGDTALDSHLALPTVERELPELEQQELVPFKRAIQAGVGTLMTAHILFPAWDEDVPATLSPKIIRDVLRRRFGFSGVVFSDDMEMKAVHGRYPIAEQVRRATRATVDILLCCKDPHLQYEAYGELIRAQEEDPALHRLTVDAVRRVHALRERFLLTPPPRPPEQIIGQRAHTDLVMDVRARVG